MTIYGASYTMIPLLSTLTFRPRGVKFPISVSVAAVTCRFRGVHTLNFFPPHTGFPKKQPTRPKPILLWVMVAHLANIWPLLANLGYFAIFGPFWGLPSPFGGLAKVGIGLVGSPMAHQMPTNAPHLLWVVLAWEWPKFDPTSTPKHPTGVAGRLLGGC